MPTVESALRHALRTVPALRAITRTQPAQHAIQTARAARTVTPARKFVAGQTRTQTRTYKLRSSGDRVTVRHRSRDIAILAEVFAENTYKPPAECPANPAVIADLGANIGLFGLYARSSWGSAVIRSYEPDPDNARLLRATAHEHPEWKVIQAAVASHAGTMRFAAGLYSESREADAGEPHISVPVLDIYAEPAADLVKMDIEGGEWAILTDSRLPRLARVIVVEWHARGCPRNDAHGTARTLLRDAGYTHQHDAVHQHAGNGVMWAWKD